MLESKEAERARLLDLYLKQHIDEETLLRLKGELDRVIEDLKVEQQKVASRFRQSLPEKP